MSGMRVSSRLRLLAAVALLLAAFRPQMAPAAEAQATLNASGGEGSQFREVGQIALPQVPSNRQSGWLVLDPPNRRGYSFTEAAPPEGPYPLTTIIQSFDLDTLKPLKQAVISGLPIASGQGVETGPGQTTYSGDIVHAVDSVEKRIYLPWYNQIPPIATNPLGGDPDSQRPVNFVLVLDEVQFDADPDHSFGYFTFVGEDQRFLAYHLVGMTVSHAHTRPGEPGRLLGLFASPYPLSGYAPAKSSISLGTTYDHTVVEWRPASPLPTGEPRAVTTGRSAPPSNPLQAVPTAPLRSTWQRVLISCGTAPLSSASAEGQYQYAKNFQWGLLPSRDALFVGCQSTPGSGAVARMSLDATTGEPTAEQTQQIYAMGKPIGDALADPAGGRLYLRSFSGGATWWAFDTVTLRYAGSIAAHQTDAKPMGAGIDTATGRLYTITPDTCAPRQGGGEIPVRGGLKMAEARLDPVPALQNVRPDMTYNSLWRIHVDSVTQRVFVRRGMTLEVNQLVYPECDLNKREPSPVEPFYRVLEDRIPLAEPPGELDDSQFTTNVKEAKGVTQASFLGSGAGYGSRVIMTGGLAAATNGATDFGGQMASPCSRDDREILVGAVNKVEVSDQSTAAEASALNADARTMDALGGPVNRCRPQGAREETEDLDRCQSFDSDALALDDAYEKPKDDNKDGCQDRKGQNLYTAECIENENPPAARGPKGNEQLRAGFRADVACEAEDEKATAFSQGSLSPQLVTDEEGGSSEPTLKPPVITVARADSTVKVTRKAGEGIRVEVDSFARGVEIAGIGSIGLIRAVGISKASGRYGGAEGEYTRTICDVHVGTATFRGCTDDEGLFRNVVDEINDNLVGRGQLRLRSPDEVLLQGTEHGYLSAVQRDRKQLFTDQTITRDRSLTVPALELMLFQGDGGAWGAGRQIVQLAGVQASTSYGIICMFGQAPNGTCADGSESLLGDIASTQRDGETITITEVREVPSSTGNANSDKDPKIIRILKMIPQAIAEAMRLLFNNPRELGLMAAVWALIYAPCYLGERRRSIRGLVARRVTGGVG